MERVQREKIQSEQKGNKRFEGEGGRECCINRGVPDEPIERWRYTS